MRRIVCSECRTAATQPMHPEDVVMGFKRRIVTISRSKRPEGLATKEIVYRPDGHQDVTIREVTSMLCDHCGEVIAYGEPVTAVTMWRGDEPPEWEKEYTQ